MAGRYSLKSIWDDLALPELAYAFKLAVGPTKLAIAFLAVASIGLVGFVLDRCSRSVVVHPRPSLMQYGDNRDFKLNVATELEVYLVAQDATSQFIERYKGDRPGQGVFATLWNFASDRFNDSSRQLLDLRQSTLFSNLGHVLLNLWLCLRAFVWAVHYHPYYSVIFFSFAFAALCFACGAVCRCAALEYAQKEKPGLFEAVEFSVEKYRALLSAPLIPFILMVVPAAVVLIGGVAAGIPWVGVIAVGLLFGLLALAGMAIVCLTMGIVAGGLLLFPAVAYECTSGRDAIGRAVCYVLNRPLWMLFYIFAAGLFGTFFYLLLRVMVFLTLKAVYGLLAAGLMLWGRGTALLERIWPKSGLFSLIENTATPQGAAETIGAFCIYVFFLLIVGLLAAYVINYVLCASTVVYALMRKKVDGTPVETIFVRLPYAAAAAKTAAAK